MASRMPEVFGTPAADTIETWDAAVHYGFRGNDTFRMKSGSGDAVAVGGTGADRYVFDEYGIGAVMDNDPGGGAGDIVEASSLALSGDYTAIATFGSRHLFIVDGATGTGIALLDWQDPANRIERYVFGDGTLTHEQLAASLRARDNYLGDIGFDRLDPPLDAGDATELHEGIAHIARRGRDIEAGLFGANPGASTTGADIMRGATVAETLAGLAGDDRLIGSPGGDRLEGGDGVDTADYGATREQIILNLLTGAAYGGDAAGDRLIEVEGIVLGSGPDRIVGSAAANVILGGGGGDEIAGADGSDSIEGGDAPDLLHGDDGADTLIGGWGDDVLLGGDGGDSLLGGEGVDRLVGGSGADSIEGGAGHDFLDYSDAPGAVGVELFAWDRQWTGRASDGAGGIDLLLEVENVYGSRFADTLTGDFGHNRLFGFAGADTLVGGAGPDGLEGMEGNDDLAGGEGDDLLAGNDGNDTIDGGAGFDAVEYTHAARGVRIYMESGGSATRDDKGGVDLLIGIEQAIGSFFADTIVGAAQADEMSGLGGSDSLLGAAGDDLLQGGDGEDTALGGSGSDVLYGGAGLDSLSGEAGDDRLIAAGDRDLMDGGAGIDTADYTWTTGPVRIALSGGAATDPFGGRLRGIENLLGGSGDDTLLGDAGANRLDGAGGRDFLGGGAGDDLLIADRNETLDGGAGLDTVDYARADRNLVLTLVDGGLVDPLGNVLRGIEGLTGDEGNDRLTGDGAANVLTGGVGTDTLAGNDGNDMLVGGTGSDTLSGGNGNDLLYDGDGANPAAYPSTDPGELAGGAGDDILFIGPGRSQAWGGPGADVFAFGYYGTTEIFYETAWDATPRLADFDPADDTLAFDAAGVGDDLPFANFVNKGGPAGGPAASFYRGPAAGAGGENVVVITDRAFATPFEAETAVVGEETGDLLLYFDTTAAAGMMLHVGGPTGASRWLARFDDVHSLSEWQATAFTVDDFVFV